MSNSDNKNTTSKMLEEILGFVNSSSGLKPHKQNLSETVIEQAVDGKLFKFQPEKLSEVLQRVDADGSRFIQINFQNGTKVLFTDTLVGFKPAEMLGLDMSKIPKVVTTPDLLSVFEAIEESMSSDLQHEQEIEVLKKVFISILQGGELAGFDLKFEKKWIGRLVPAKFSASA